MKKLYYSIGEVCERTGVEPHILRYWETVFPQLNPSKSKSGNRRYSEKHLDIALKLKELIKEKKYSTAGALKALNQENNSGKTSELPDVSEDIKKDLAEIKVLLQRLHSQL